MTTGPQWNEHMLGAGMHLDSPGFVRGYTGEAIAPRMQTWTRLIPG